MLPGLALSPFTVHRESPLEAARDVWRAGEKLLRGQKLYGDGHATTHTFAVEMHAVLDAYLKRFGALEVTLSPGDVLLDGESVLRSEAPDKNFAHALAHEGVVRLRLE